MWCWATLITPSFLFCLITIVPNLSEELNFTLPLKIYNKHHYMLMPIICSNSYMRKTCIKWARAYNPTRIEWFEGDFFTLGYSLGWALSNHSRLYTLVWIWLHIPMNYLCAFYHYVLPSKISKNIRKPNFIAGTCNDSLYKCAHYNMCPKIRIIFFYYFLLDFI